MRKGKGLLRWPLFLLVVCAAPLIAKPRSGPLAHPVLTCSGGDADLAIIACTMIIKSGKLSSLEQAAAFYDRARAWHQRLLHIEAMGGDKGNPAKDRARILADYAKAIALDPGLAEAYVNRGIIRFEQRQFDRAVADYSEAIRLRPNLAEAWNNRSLARHRLGQYELAKADFDQTIRLNQYYGNALINRELGPLPVRTGYRQ